MGTLYYRTKHADSQRGITVSLKDALILMDDIRGISGCTCCLPTWRGEGGTEVDLVFSEDHGGYYYLWSNKTGIVEDALFVCPQCKKAFDRVLIDGDHARLDGCRDCIDQYGVMGSIKIDTAIEQDLV